MRGSVTKVRNGVWRVAVNAGHDPVTGKRKRLVRNVHGTKRDAEDVCAQLIVSTGQGRGDGHDTTLGELIERWFARAELALSTRRSYRGTIDRWLPAPLAAMKIERVRAHHLDQLYADMATHVGPDRIRRLHSIISQSLAQAVRWRWIATNPARDATPPSQPAPNPLPPSAAVVRKILAAADEDFLAYLALSATLGARRSEILALRWGDIDLETAEVAIRGALVDGGPGVGVVAKGTKTGRPRAVALDGATITILRRHRAVCAQRCLAVGAQLSGDAWVFSVDADGMTPWRPDSATKRMARLRASVGVEGVTIRQLRHFVATELLAAGVDPRTVAGRLGHARTSTTTDIYAAFVPARDRDAANVIGDVLRQVSGE